MSNTQRQYIDLILKGFVATMVCAIGFFLVRIVDRVDSTYSIVIRLEEKVNRLEKDFEVVGKKKL